MIINRNNYEEFLLLYIDGELSAGLQKEIENFLELNADIQLEFNNLLDTKLQAEPMSFGDISILLKNENAINKSNCVEHFLLFTDSELTLQQQQATETFVLQHPELQNEFIAIQQTKLPIEIIEYPNKEELYRKEKKPIVFYLQRIAVAAVFMGFGAFIYKMVDTKEQEKYTAYNQPKIVDVTTKKEVTILPPSLLEPTVTPAISSNKTVTVLAKTVTNSNKKNNKKNVVNSVTNNTIPALNTQANALVETAIINSNALLEAKNKQALNSLVTTDIKPLVSSKEATIANSLSSERVVNTVVYKTLDEDDDNENASTKKSKLKNLLRKAAKMITPKETSDDDSRKLFAVTL